MPDKSEPPSSDAIVQIRTASFLPMGLCAALELEIFTVLSSGPMTAEQIASEIGVKPRRLKMLLLPLVVGEYLELDSETFSNAPISDYYLVKGKPNYLGGRSRTLADPMVYVDADGPIHSHRYAAGEN